MNKKAFLIIFIIGIFACSTVYAAKYSVSTNGTVKSKGKVISHPTQTQQNYNVYRAPQYITMNQVNSGINVNNIELVMDYSGSMSNWIYEAKKAMTDIIAQIPKNTNVGFRVFGHDYNGINPSQPAVLGVVNKIVKKNGKLFYNLTRIVFF